MPHGAYKSPEPHYDAATIALHWTTALLVAVLWVSEQVAGWFGRGAPAMLIRSSHITLGVILALVLLTRLGWRLGPGRALPAADRGVLHVMAKLTHYALYLLLAVTVLLGITNWLAHGDSVFGLVQLPKPNFGAATWPRQVRGWHGLAANTLLIVAGLHAAAALFHHYAWHDRVLSRMLPIARD